jgi:hypothetical protein
LAGDEGVTPVPDEAVPPLPEEEPGVPALSGRQDERIMVNNTIPIRR